MGTILLINGPNRIGQPGHDPQYYGTIPLSEINDRLAKLVSDRGHCVEFFEGSNETELVQRVRAANNDETGVIVINPTRLTTKGFELREAFEEVDVPFIEIHISNIFRRNAFRHHSLFSDLSQGLITGVGARGYEYAIDTAVHILEDPDAELHDY